MQPADLVVVLVTVGLVVHHLVLENELFGVLGVFLALFGWDSA